MSNKVPIENMESMIAPKRFFLLFLVTSDTKLMNIFFVLLVKYINIVYNIIKKFSSLQIVYAHEYIELMLIPVMNLNPKYAQYHGMNALAGTEIACNIKLIINACFLPYLSEYIPKIPSPKSFPNAYARNVLARYIFLSQTSCHCK